MYQNTRWLRLELDEHIVVMPEQDIYPHGKKMRKNYKITDEDAKTCLCDPTVETHCTDEEGNLHEYEKIVVVHNSFENKQRVYQAMNSTRQTKL